MTGPQELDPAEYWQRVLAGQDELRWPGDRPRPPAAAGDRGQAELVLPDGTLASLTELSRREGTPLPVTMLAALAALLSRWTGQNAVVMATSPRVDGPAVGDPVAAGLAVASPVVAGTVPVRIDLTGDPEFTGVLAAVQQAAAEAQEHPEPPSGWPAAASQVSFRLAGAGQPDSGPGHGAGRARPELSLLALAGERELRITAEYAAELLEPETVARLLDSYAALLAGVAADPAARVSRLPVLQAAERDRELTGWHGPALAVPDSCLHREFEALAAAAPAAVAAVCGGEELSYGELNGRANQIARWLRSAGIGPETLAGICMQPGLDRLTVLAGILKAGGGYVPLDPELPLARLSFMTADAGLALVLADQAGETATAGLAGVRVVPVGRLMAEAAGLDRADLTGPDLGDASAAGPGGGPSSVAYVIYTSGSTGQPKGVVIEHRQAVAFARAMIQVFGLGPDDTTLGFASLSFDVSVMDMFLALLSGGRVAIVPPDVRRSPPRLAELINSARVTYACLTPSVMGLLTEFEFPALRYLVSGGEELSGDLAAVWQRPGRGLELYNTYGPTEAAVVTTWIPLPPGGPVPPAIGRPLPNYRAYVLDAQLSPVPAGVVGELHIGGPGVARGYLNRPGLTAARFIADPFRGALPGARLYKSGDLVRRRGDGTIVFCGRVDHQVKIRGLRIELGEIEAALESCPGITRAAVTVVTDTAGDRQLAGYLQPAPRSAADETGPDLAAIRAHLARVLPGYLIPAYLTVLAELPRNTSGKISRDALPRPAGLTAPGTEPVPPRTLIETVLVSLYASVLGREQVGATDSFFDVGGDSLRAMHLVTKLRSALAVDLDVTALFLAPAPRQLAALLRDKHGLDDADLSAEGSGQQQSTDEETGTMAGVG